MKLAMLALATGPAGADVVYGWSDGVSVPVLRGAEVYTFLVGLFGEVTAQAVVHDGIAGAFERITEHKDELTDSTIALLVDEVPFRSGGALEVLYAVAPLGTDLGDRSNHSLISLLFFSMQQVGWIPGTGTPAAKVAGGWDANGSPVHTDSAEEVPS